MSETPGPTHSPYGEPDPYAQSTPSPYGQQPAGQPYGYGQQPSYGQPATMQQPGGDRRPGTVTAAAWITIVFSGITAALFGLAGLGLLVARDEVVAEMEKQPEFQDLQIDLDQAYGVGVAFVLGFVVWAVIAVVLAVFVLRRSNVARILLVISSAVVALFSLISIGSVVSAVTLLASGAVIVLLFVGGAGDWFKHVTSHPGGGYGSGYGDGYGGGYPAAPTGYPADQAPSSGNPYGQPDPYGQQPPAEGGTDYPPKDYPGR
jgi:hypothetical protein